MVKSEVNVVDGYILKQPADFQLVLQHVRRIIRMLLPEAEETISYQIPTCKLHGQSVVYFAGWKRHWSLYPVTEAVRAALDPELDSYQRSKGTIRFSLADPVPTTLVERIVAELASTAEARRLAKEAASSQQVGRRGRTGR
jgi:uncharacterized protein YdhG (YjbR/CyaY superfamily)